MTLTRAQHYGDGITNLQILFRSKFFTNYCFSYSICIDTPG